MDKEILKLAESVCIEKGWSESYLSRKFGHGTLMTIARDEKRRSWPETEQRFKAWLEALSNAEKS